MKKALVAGMGVFLLSVVFNPVCFAQPGGKKGKGPPPKQPTHEEFVAMYDRDGDGEVSMDEFLEGPKAPPGGKKGPKGPPPGK